MRVAIAIITVVAACRPATTPVAPAPPRVAAAPAPAAPRGPALPRQVIAAGESMVLSVAAEGDLVAWVRDDGELGRATLSSGEAATLATLTAPGHVAVAGGDVYAIDGDQLLRFRGGAGASEAVATGVDGWQLAVDGGVAYVATRRTIGKVDPGGGYVELVADAGLVSGIAVADGWVYWADEGVRPQRSRVRVCTIGSDGKSSCTERAPRLGTIRRVPVAGGAVETIAADQYYPSDVAVVGDHVVWTATDGEALMRAPVAGGAPRVRLHGRGAAIAADDAGTVVGTLAGMIVEVPSTGAPRVLATTWYGEAPLALTPTHVITADVAEVVAYPRGAGRVTAVATAHGRFDDLDLVDGTIYVLDVHVDRPDRIVAVLTRGGRPRELGRVDGRLQLVASDGTTTVAFDVDRGVIVTPDGRVVATEVYAQGLAVRGDEVLWVDGAELHRASLVDGQTDLLIEPLSGYGTSGRPPEATILLAPDEIVTCGGMMGGGYRLAGGNATELPAGIVDCARAGDRTVAWVAEHGLIALPDGEVLVADAGLHVLDLAGRPGEAWALVEDHDGGTALVRIPLDGGDVEPVLKLPTGDAWLAADADGVYVAWKGGDVLLRIAP